MKFNKGSELDKQIYKEGESTYGCKEGVLDVEDIKEFIKRRLEDLNSLKENQTNVEGVIKKFKFEAGNKFYNNDIHKKR